jgi:hypothetical protein
VRDPEKSVAAFDSAVGLLRGLAAALHGQDLPRLGQPVLVGLALRTSTLIPGPVRRLGYALGGPSEAMPEEALGDVDLGAVATWLTEQYPQRRYPGVILGAANGALTHLAAAAQIPWLPQTVLVPVHSRNPDATAACEWGARAAPALLEANPDVELHHMHDANQDELMVGRMAYFRTKWQALPAGYRRFLAERLRPGAPIILYLDGSRWPVTRIGPRHVFQTGAYGGLPVEQAVKDGPPVDDEAAEAEWGSTAAFAEAVEAWAAEFGHPVWRVTTDDPQHFADRAAAVLADWVGTARPRVLVESFIQVHPWHALRTRTVPYWTVFPVEHCADAAEHFLAGIDPEVVDVVLFQHGAQSDGLATIDRWQRLTALGRRPGTVIGTHERRFPSDFGALARTAGRLRRIPDGPPWSPLPVERLRDA